MPPAPPSGGEEGREPLLAHGVDGPSVPTGLGLGRPRRGVGLAPSPRGPGQPGIGRKGGMPRARLSPFMVSLQDSAPSQKSGACAWDPAEGAGQWGAGHLLRVLPVVPPRGGATGALSLLQTPQRPAPQGRPQAREEVGEVPQLRALLQSPTQGGPVSFPALSCGVWGALPGPRDCTHPSWGSSLGTETTRPSCCLRDLKATLLVPGTGHVPTVVPSQPEVVYLPIGPQPWVTSFRKAKISGPCGLCI